MKKMPRTRASPRRRRAARASVRIAPLIPQPPRKTPSFLAQARTWQQVRDRFVGHSDAIGTVGELWTQLRRSEYHLVAPMCAAHALETYELLPAEPGELSVAILGAEKLDHGLDGRLYQLLPRLVGRPDLRMHVEVVGPQYERASRAVRLDRLGLPAANTYRMRCGAWLARRGERPPPDVTLIFHPGLESHAREWLTAGELPVLLRMGRPALVFSYDEDEAERDAFILKSHGATVSEVRECVLGLTPASCACSTQIEFARAMFQVQGYGPSDELSEVSLEAMALLSQAVSEVVIAEGRRDRHADTFRPYPIWRGEELRVVYHVLGRVYYDFERDEIFLAEQGRSVEESIVPLERTPILEAAVRDELPSLGKAVLAATLFSNMRWG